MKYLKKAFATLLILSLATSIACVSDTKFTPKKNKNNPNSENNADTGNNNADTEQVNTDTEQTNTNTDTEQTNTDTDPIDTGQTNPNNDIDDSLLINALDETQLKAVCDAQIENRGVLNPSTNAGKGACITQAYIGTEERFMSEGGSTLDICNELYDTCLVSFDQYLAKPCILPNAIPTCTATVKQFDDCAADQLAHEVAISEGFQSAMDGGDCTKLFDHDGPIDADLQFPEDMPNLADDIPSCQILEQKCPGYVHNED